MAAMIASTAISAIQTPKEIQRGLRTQNQDHAMYPVSFKPTNSTVRRVVSENFICCLVL